MSVPVSTLIFIVRLANILSAYLEIKCIHLMLVLVNLPLRNPCMSGILPEL